MADEYGFNDKRNKRKNKRKEKKKHPYKHGGMGRAVNVGARA